MVCGHGQRPRALPVLQGRQPRSAGGLVMTPPIQVDIARLIGDLEQLARFSDAEAPGVTRVLFTEKDLQARAFLKGRFAETGLAVREDPAGNLFARWAGSEPALPAVGSGSHTDAIPFSGRYDGTVGVLG